MVTLRITGDTAADDLLGRDPLALLIGMLLDQQVTMEKAFRGPYDLTERLGGDLDAARIASYDPEKLVALFSTPPAIHRYPGSMAGRVQALCAYLVEHYDGDAEAIWRDAPSGADLLKRLKALPGFGDQKARIFLALLGKQVGVQPPGWREAAGGYGVDGSLMSVADITSPETLAAVRENKRAMKAAAKK